MKKNRIIWHLFPSYFLITLLSIVAVSTLTSREIRNFHAKETEQSLLSKAAFFRQMIIEDDLIKSPDEIDRLCKELGEVSGTRFTIVLPDGQVIGDTDENPAKMENHAGRPEISEALRNGKGGSVRQSDTLGENMMYVAIHVTPEVETIAVVRTAVSTSSLDSTLTGIFYQTFIYGLLILCFAALIGFWVAKRLSRPLEDMKEIAENFADGNFDRKLGDFPTLEMSALAQSMNIMAEQLDERISNLARERNEKEAILHSMVEGVIAIDMDERIFQLNNAAANLFNSSNDAMRGRYIHEVIRNAELQRFVKKVIQTRKQQEEDITLIGASEKYLQVLGTILLDTDNKSIGVLIVMNDITRLRRLERIRQDFVANVSHELKTPITSIKGFVETILDSEPENMTELKRFLEIVLTQSDRLNAIIEDLLTLSSLEQDTPSDRIYRQSGSIAIVLKSSIQTCQIDAKNRNISIVTECEDNLDANVNSQLLEQAVVNLLNNAIKYSPEGGEVILGAKRESRGIGIYVTDHGTGIAKEHLPRLFERFYRVDKARSRELGGTGLGLAIVKHIANAHGGGVSVESTLGKGSTFHIHIPD